MAKANKIYNILRMRCPRCHSDDLFETRLIELRKLLTMKDHCTKCGQEFELEPGFYWGAMYVAYGISSGIILGSFVILRFILGYSMMNSYVAVSILIIFMIPIVFRLARSLWINLYVKYDPEAIQKKEQQE
jgi:uncharacterized protein (DUF983 family)